jgi:phosphotriesterase-related protein
MVKNNSGYLQTIKGPIPVNDFGLILPHEHLFTDLRGPSTPGYAVAEIQDVLRKVSPFLKEAFSSGVTGLVECSTVGVGRNIQILKAISDTTPIHIIIPTGVYREEYIPIKMKPMATEELGQQWIQELSEGIEGSEMRAGFIKISMSDDGPTKLEERSLQAASIASQQTGVVVASHTANGIVFEKELESLNKAGLDPSRFIWVHANLESDSNKHAAAAKAGVYVEFDGVGAQWQSQEAMIKEVIHLLDAGYIDNILLSHDAGWYDPGSANGEPEGGFRGYTALMDEFIPTLESRGVSKEEINQMTHDNPIRAFTLHP